MTPSSCEIQLWLNWIPWENIAQYQLVTLQRGQQELYLWSDASCAHSTQELWSSQGWSPRATAKLRIPGTQQKEHSGSKARGSGWKGTQLSSASPGASPEAALDISDISCLTHAPHTQLTAWGGFACQSAPGAGCKDQSPATAALLSPPASAR